MTISDWVQIGIALFGLGVALLGVIAKNLFDLNRNILIIVERVDSHERRLNRLETITHP